MRRLIPLLFLSVTALLSAGEGRLLILSHRTDVFKNTDCKKNNTCDLKTASITVEDYSIGVQGYDSYGTRMLASWRTDSAQALEKYAYVQLIRGCMYDVSNDDGTVTFGFQHRYFTGHGLFRHPDWVFDTDNPDTVYSSLANAHDFYKCGTWEADSECKDLPRNARFFSARWNPGVPAFSAKNEKLQGREKTSGTELYITDRPGTAFRHELGIKNISLQFRTCLYKSADVPYVMTPESPIHFAEPIHCFEWDSSFIYNPTTKTHERTHEISPVCSQ